METAPTPPMLLCSRIADSIGESDTLFGWHLVVIKFKGHVAIGSFDLIRPRFPQSDVVVHSGNFVYQSVIDPQHIEADVPESQSHSKPFLGIHTHVIHISPER